MLEVVIITVVMSSMLCQSSSMPSSCCFVALPCLLSLSCTTGVEELKVGMDSTRNTIQVWSHAVLRT